MPRLRACVRRVFKLKFSDRLDNVRLVTGTIVCAPCSFGSMPDTCLGISIPKDVANIAGIAAYIQHHFDWNSAQRHKLPACRRGACADPAAGRQHRAPSVCTGSQRGSRSGRRRRQRNAKWPTAASDSTVGGEAPGCCGYACCRLRRAALETALLCLVERRRQCTAGRSGS